MYGCLGSENKWKQRRHMLPVPVANATPVADAVSSTPDFFCKDGRKIRVGDSALFKPPQDSPPFIGIIRRLTLDKGNLQSLGVNWLYRPADIKLGKGVVLEAAPNEVFYSFHKDEIPAASLLHPCKVAFLRKGVELPSGISSFVCRRVYDIENKCLWWLTDKDYINERQEEVDQLLDKTRLEMHGAVQSGGRSPKPLNNPTSTSTPQLKPGSDSVQNSASFSSQVKGKRKERGDQGSDPPKRERLFKTTEDGESGQSRPENMLRSEISKITDKGGLVDFEGVEKLVQLMQPGSAEKKIDLAGRMILTEVIAVTDRLDCLGWFVQLKGLPVLDEWLQEVHKGKIGDCSGSKEGDKSVEEFLLALLRALDKVPVNLHALQTCNVGKSVNHLRTHKNSEIQKKARSLVDTWKKRVEAEMNINDAKSGSTRGVSWPTKPVPSEASHVGNRKTGGPTEVGTRSSLSHPSASKNLQVKLGTVEAVSKSTASPGSAKSITISAGIMLKDPNFRMLVGSGTSDFSLTPIKEERSSSSSQSQNNSQSCSSDHGKVVGSSYKEDARSSTAGSVNANKSSNGASRHRKSSNGILGSAVSKQNSTSEKASPTGVSPEKLPDVPLVDHGNSQRLIVRIPNTGRSPARSGTGGSFDYPAVKCARVSPPAENPDHHDKAKRKSDAFRADESNALPAGDEQNADAEDGERLLELSKATVQSSGIIPRLGKTHEASLSSINALVESCVKFSEASASASPGDDVGMNLLASVAAGEMSKSGNVPLLGSPGRNSPLPEESSLGNDAKLRHVGEEIAQTHYKPNDGAGPGAGADQGITVDSLLANNDERHPATPDSSGYNKVISFGSEKKGECTVQLNSSSTNLQQDADGPRLRSDGGEPRELIHDASVAVFPVHTKKEGFPEAEGANQIHEQRKSGAHGVRDCSISDSKSNVRTPLLDEYKVADNADERTLENCVGAVSEAAVTSEKVENEVKKELPCSPSEMGGKNQDTVIKKPSGGNLTEQKPALRAEILSESIKGSGEDVLPHSGPANVLAMEFKAEKADDTKPRGHVELAERQGADIGTSISDHNDKYGEGKIERKDALVHCSDTQFPHADPPTVPVCKTEQSEKSNGCKVGEVESGDTKGWYASGVNASLSAAAPDMAIKLDFDLNEGIPVDDGSQGESVKASVSVSSSIVPLPCPLPFPISSISEGFSASITVAAAAKGPFVPPENPLRRKGELGWKGSAATSAFRPAEPRKILDISLNTSNVPTDTSSSKQGRTPLDIDLNVPDQRVYDDTASQSSARLTCSGSGPRDCGAGGLDLDLNRVDESPDTGPFFASNSCRLEIPFPRSSLPSGLTNGGVNISRNFDLNNGPGLDEVGTTETAPHFQHIKSSIPFTSPIPGIRVNSAELGNISSWFTPGSSYSPIPVPSMFPGRGEQSYVTAAGSHRILGPPGSTLFGPEAYRGPVLQSSPAVAFSPATPYQYPGFPFETSFPLSSNSFSGCSTAYMDSSSGGALCFPTIPSQLVGPAGVVSSPYSRPYVISLPGSASNVGPESRKWGGQGLDLNAGPGSTDTERRDRLPTSLRQLSIPGSQAVAEEQLKMFQVPGGVLKRKEPDSGWDPVDRFSYKQPSWQ